MHYFAEKTSMHYVLFDDHSRNNFLPFTFTRPIADIRIGIRTIREKWEAILNSKTYSLTQAYLSKKYPNAPDGKVTYINGALLPSAELINAIEQLTIGEALYAGQDIIAAVGTGVVVNDWSLLHSKFTSKVNFTGTLTKLAHNWDIFSLNEMALVADYHSITAGRKSATIAENNQVINASQIFIEQGAVVQCAVLNASAGPIYIGKNAEVMEGALIRGPFSLGEHSQIKMGAKIYGATTIGPHCKVGGEVGNSVIFGYTNKAHEGYMGNSVIGEWCNWGADTNNSNLKNNYSQIKVWDYATEEYINTKLQFVGLIMGDHSKCSINTMFNTGTVVGVNANIFGTGFPPKFIPSFAWGGGEGMSTYRLEDSFEVAQRVYDRRKMDFNQTEKDIMTHIFEVTSKFRIW
ncbi:MAG: hypothetical protein RIQ89_273 [Bacteroidota bacterium]|jgi:UDP-N-acetylglucosamine diphosphorylase/glucosamine-1-phosphate N-acetyltransferase